jgi:uncharacterized membrane protein YphA (DoxX/SURF4 family)
MKLTIRMQKVILELICLLYILLFVYAAVSKLMDFDNFQVQLGQSPLLSAFAGPISYIVLIVEFGVSIMLGIPKMRRTGFFCAFLLMLVFTTYIVFILNYSSFVPCSCGGILEKMGWTEHLIFNIVFTVLALAAYLAERRNTETYTLVIFGSFFSILLVFILYTISERVLHHQNPFVRRFDRGVVEKTAQADLQMYNAYFAGAGNGKVFLSNTNTPLVVYEWDNKLQRQIKHIISIDHDKYPFRSVQLKVVLPYFFVFDGTVPVIFRGKVSDWKAFQIMMGNYYFSKIVVMDSLNIAFRAQDRYSKENILGKFSFSKKMKVTLINNILQKQKDGIFDTDGTMSYDPILKNLTYLYYYRNQFIVTNQHLKLDYRGNTIDTTTRAAIKVNYFKESGERKPSTPAVTINKYSASYGRYLFVNSGLRGKFEPLDLWKTSSVIDIYDLKNNTYVSSFYAYDIGEDKISDIMVNSEGIYIIIGKTLQKYRLHKNFN